MDNKKYPNVAAYFADFEPTQQQKLEEIRAIIKQAAPDATEVISYNMPAFKQNKVLVYYAAYKNHIGFYPTSKPIIVFADKLKNYKTSKGAVQFPLDKPIPKTLVKEMVKFRMKEDAGKGKM